MRTLLSSLKLWICRWHVLSTAILCSLTLTILAPRAGRFLCVTDPIAPANAIVVLGGEADSFNRTAHGVQLYGRHMAPLVVFSGAFVTAPGTVFSSVNRSRTAGLALGLPATVAIGAPEARNTYEEAQNLGVMAAAHGWRTLIVVTDEYHSYRAARVFRTVNPGLTIILSPAPLPGYNPARWWANPAGARYVGGELLKLAYYWLRYGVAPF